MFLVCSIWSGTSIRVRSFLMELSMEHDLRLRAAARAIYDACYPAGECTPVNFDEAERWRTMRYRQAVGAALDARSVLADQTHQPSLFKELARA
jgi:hypothetical protein